jgi:hypothetical protein
MTTTYSQSRAFFNDLAALLTRGQLLFPEDAAYEPARQLWNGKVKTRPAAIARLIGWMSRLMILCLQFQWGAWDRQKKLLKR